MNVTLSTDEARTIKITIINDNTFELTETFVVHLSFADQETLPPGVTLNQTSAQVYILDNDGEFLCHPVPYTCLSKTRACLICMVVINRS